MKTFKNLFKFSVVLLMAVTMLTITSCKKDKDNPVFTLESLMTGTIDLAGVTSAVDVPEDGTIEAVFSSNVDAATVTATSVTLEDDGGAAVDLSLTVSDTKITIDPVDKLDGGTLYTINLTLAIKGTNGVAFEGVTFTFTTAGIFVPQKEYQVLFLSFDNQTAIDEAGSHTVTKVGTLNFETDRKGTASSAATFDGLGNLVEVAAAADLISPSITISFWAKTNLADYNGQASSGSPQTRFVMGLGAELGYFLEMGRRSSDPISDFYNEIYIKPATDHVNIGTNAAANPKATAWGELNSQSTLGYDLGASKSGWSYLLDGLLGNKQSISDALMDKWSHFVLTFDKASQSKTYYINGVKFATFKWVPSGAEWLMSDLSLKDDVAGVNGILSLGFACSSTNTSTGWADYQTNLTNAAESKKFFKGSLDQFRIFSIALSDADVLQLYNNEK